MNVAVFQRRVELLSQPQPRRNNPTVIHVIDDDWDADGGPDIDFRLIHKNVDTIFTAKHFFGEANTDESFHFAVEPFDIPVWNDFYKLALVDIDDSTEQMMGGFSTKLYTEEIGPIDDLELDFGELAITLHMSYEFIQ